MRPTRPPFQPMLFRAVLIVLGLSLVAAACGGDTAESEAAVVAPTAASTSPTDVPVSEPEADATAAPVDEPAPAATAQPEPEPQPEPTETPAVEPVTVGPVDITNATLVSTAASCESYVGTYTSMITDTTTGTDFAGMLTISTDGSTCAFSTNQIPNHDTGEGSNFRSDIAEVDATLEVPAQPQLADSPTALGMGASVIMLNGVKWEAYPAACFAVGNEAPGREAIGCGGDQIENPWRYNIGSPLNNFGFDDYLAHIQPGGLYHYHSTPTVLYDIDCEGTEVSPVVGYAADGFPVFGPCFADEDGTIRAAESGYQVKSGVREDVAGYTTPYVTGNVLSDSYDGQFIGDHEWVDGVGDLDACNGMTIDGQYGYYITGSYPYVLACYSGAAAGDFR